MRGTAYFFRGNQTRMQVNLQAAQGDLLRAKADLDKAIKTYGKMSKVWILKANVHLLLRELREGCFAIKKACETGDCRLVGKITKCNR